MSACLSRRGNARAAADLEAGPEFAVLRRRPSELPVREAEGVVGGLLCEDAPAGLTDALRAVASRIEQVRADDMLLSSPAEVVFAGRVADQVGALLALVVDKLDGASVAVEAIPAIDIDDALNAREFSPFGRGDART